MSTAVHVGTVAAEHRHDSPFIATNRPRLSWIVAAAPAGWSQMTAEVRLDGERVASLRGADHTLVQWPFAPLSDDRTHAVEVRVADASGSFSEWSDPLELRLASVVAWSAPFIGLDSPDRPAQPVLLSHAFRTDRQVVSALAHVSAFGIAEVAINGSVIDDSVLGPGWTSYDNRVLHDTVDVLAPLGANPSHTIEVRLTGGWFTEEYGFGPTGARVYGEQPSVAIELHLRYADGGSEVIRTDPTWSATGDWQIVASGIYAGETVDLRRRPGAGTPARILQSGVVPEARTLEPVRRIEEVVPVAIERMPSGTHRLDFGQNLVGRLRLSVDGPADTEIVVRHAEVLEDDELGTRPLRRAAATDRFVLNGGPHVLEPMGTFHGFRYAEISGWPGELGLDSVRALVLHNDMRRTGWFESSNELLNRLHENVVWSMRGNFLSVPTDCPQRDERMGWTGDVQVFAPTAATLYDSRAFLGNWLSDLAFEQGKRDGVVPFVVPDVLRYPVGPTAAWGDAATVVPSVLAERFGDEGVLRDQFDSMRAWVDSILAVVGADGLWEGHIQLGDWLDPEAPPDNPGAAKVPSDIVATAHLFRSADLVARAADRLGRDDLAAEYAQIAERTRSAFLATYVTPAGRMTADAPTAYALALSFGIATDPVQREQLGDRLAQVSRRHAFHIATGFVGTPLLLDALIDTGHADIAGRLLLQTGLPSWLYPVTMGATTVWERWDSMLPDGSINPGEMTSFNHYAFGAVVDWLYRRLVGIAPASPAYRRIRFAPTPLQGLDRAGATVDTPSGRVMGGWEREVDTLRFHLTVPVHATAEVVLPDGRCLGVGAGSHSWIISLATVPPAPHPSIESSFRDIADDPEALAAVLGVLRAHDPAYEALVRRRIDWNVTDPLPAGLFDMPPQLFGTIAQALGELTLGRAAK
ncbi:family 78 glycoside hydrolase catalytic domain [Microbacterium sp.]|uniref:alpha-L-rhamnosidase n=1 Tax=Microbacterium sp. TaxID=51671 RepID=UPI003A9026A7